TLHSSPTFSPFFINFAGTHPALHSFPTRRSSDLLTRRHGPAAKRLVQPSTLHQLHAIEAKAVALAYFEHRHNARVVQPGIVPVRSEEHTSELQSRGHLVCRLLLEKKKKLLDTALI